MPLDEYRLVDDPDALLDALDWLSDLDPIGVDVERADWDRYYRAAALVQVGGGGRVALLDPIRLDDWSEVDQLFSERAVLLHALENDVAPLQALGVDPPIIHDTAIAAALLGMPTGLETLLEEVLGISMDLDKSAMQRAQWEKRPLTEDMLVYAAGDVADLPELWRILEARLHDAGRWAWYEEERKATIGQPSVEDRRDWTRTRGVGRLDPAARARAKVLWEAREDIAQETDTAPGRILNDKVLLDLCQRPPKSVRELGRRGVRRQAVKTFGEQIMDALADAEEADPLPIARRGRRSTDEDRDLADALRVARAAIADEMGLDAGLLCPSRTLLGAVVSDPSTPQELREALELRDWQWALIGDAFTDIVFGAATTTDEATAQSG